MKIKIFNKRKQEFVKNEMYEDTYCIDLEGNVEKYEYNDRYGSRWVNINQDDYDIIFDEKTKEEK